VDSAGLEDIPLFADLTDEERAQVASALREATAEPGTMVATSPMRLRAMFIRELKDLERSMPQLASSLRDAMSERPWSR
jgi:hypothetical protein